MFNRLENRANLLSLLALTPFDLVQPLSKFYLIELRLTHPDKRPHYGDICMARSLPRTDESMANPNFGKGIRRVLAVTASRVRVSLPIDF
jgi:hypothetical protein